MTNEAPAYDPKVHTVEDDNPTVLVEMWCLCGGLWTQIDPVSHVLPQIEDFQSKHSGDGHGRTTAKKALLEREVRREASFRAAGRQSEYESKKRTAPAGSGFDWTKGSK